MLKGLRVAIRKRYESEDILVQKKSVLLLYANICVIIIMVSLPGLILFMPLDFNQKMSAVYAASPLVAGSLVSLLLLRFFRYGPAAAVLVITVAITGGGALASKYFLSPHTGFGITTFFHAAIIFAALFSSLAVTTLVTVLLAGYTVVFYFLAKPQIDGVLAVTFQNFFMDGTFAIILTYFLTVLVIKTMSSVVSLMREEAEKNHSQYQLIKSLFQTCVETSDKLSFSSEEMSSASERLSNDAQGQAASLEEISSTLNELNAHFSSIEQGTIESFNVLLEHLENCDMLADSILKLREGTMEISGTYDRIRELIGEARSCLKGTTESSGMMMENSKKVSEIVTIIGDFFERINLLSLNASIEAARAGEYGRGFAVVADEISKLADQSAASLKEITALIETNNHGVAVSSDTNETLNTVIENIFNELENLQNRMQTLFENIEDQNRVKGDLESQAGLLKSRSEEIKNATAEQKNAIEMVTSAVTTINDITQSNASHAEEVASTSCSIMEMAKDLSVHVSRGHG